MEAAVTTEDVEHGPYSRAIFAREKYRGAHVTDIDPFTPEIFDNPHEFHAALRDAGPIAWLSVHKCWAVARHEQVHAVGSDWQTFSSARGVGLADYEKEKPLRPPSPLMEVDPPQHTELRQILNRIISAPAIKHLRARWTEIAETIVDRCLEKREFDCVKDLSEEYPLTVMPEAIGLKLDKTNLLPYGSAVFTQFGPDNQLRRDAANELDSLGPWLGQQIKRENLAPVGFGAEFYAAADRGEIKPEYAPMFVRAVLAAGLDTTVNTISAAVEAFAANPDQWDKLRGDPSLARATFEETIRYDSPVQAFFRTTAKPVAIGDVELREGEKIVMFFGAANHDPRRWKDPFRFDISRKVSGHVGFGAGPHMCVGQFIARLEGEVLFNVMASKVKTIEVTGPTKRRYNNLLRGLSTLPVRMTPVHH